MFALTGDLGQVQSPGKRITHKQGAHNMATTGKATANRGGRKAKTATEQPAAAEAPKQAARRGRGKVPATPVPPTTFRTADDEALAQSPADAHPIDGAPVQNGTPMKAPSRKRAARQPEPVTTVKASKAAMDAALSLVGGDASRLRPVDSNTVIIVN